MTEATDNSSLPLLLSMTGAILLVAVGGWFFLGLDTTPVGGGDRASGTPSSAAMVSPSEAPPTDAADTEKAEKESPKPEKTIAGEAPAPVGVDADLRKARMAANADILVFPEEQSALHYYGLALAEDPQNAVAVAELDAILASVAQTVANHLDAREYDEAYRIAVLVARQRPEHTLVVETQRRLDDITEQLVEQAVEQARAGKDQESDKFVTTAAALPGRNPAYIAAIRESIAEIRNVRVAAERDRTRRAQLAADEARAAWVASVRGAIAAGNLIAPVGASARDLLAEENQWTAEQIQLAGELGSALVDTTQFYMNAGRLVEAETLLNVFIEMGYESERYTTLRDTLETAFIESESRRVASLKELVQTKSAVPRYPRRAQAGNITGWVEVYFTVTPSGGTTDVEIARSDPETVFDRAATSAVEDWEFEPVEYRGQVISRRAAAKLVFALE